MSDGTECPVYFVARALMAAEQNYAQIEREAPNLAWGMLEVSSLLDEMLTYPTN